MGVWEDSVSRSLTDKNVQKNHRRLLKSRIDCNPVDGDFGVGAVQKVMDSPSLF
jgi:hypothetical protein